MKTDDITRQRFEAMGGLEIYNIKVPAKADTDMIALIKHINTLAAHIIKIEKHLGIYPSQDKGN